MFEGIRSKLESFVLARYELRVVALSIAMLVWLLLCNAMSSRHFGDVLMINLNSKCFTLLMYEVDQLMLNFVNLLMFDVKPVEIYEGQGRKNIKKRNVL